MAIQFIFLTYFFSYVQILYIFFERSILTEISVKNRNSQLGLTTFALKNVCVDHPAYYNNILSSSGDLFQVGSKKRAGTAALCRTYVREINREFASRKQLLLLQPS